MKVYNWQIKVTDRTGAQKALFGARASKPAVVRASWDWLKDGGCGTFEMDISPRHGGAINCGYLVEVRVQPTSSDTLDRYYTGSIIEKPSAGHTGKLWRYKAVGLAEQLKTTLITKYYAGDDIDEIVKDILADYYAGTDISSATTGVVIAVPYTLGDAEFEMITAHKAIQLLADTQQDVQWGVDHTKTLFFKDLSTSIVATYYVSHHVKSFEPVERRDKLYNHLFVQGKEPIGGGMLTLQDDDGTSVTAYGRRQKLGRIPHLREPDDIWRYIQSLLSDGKDPKLNAPLVLLQPFRDFRQARGKVRIVDTDGSNIDLPIERVSYELVPKEGLRGEYELGQEQIPKFSEEIKQALLNIQTEKETTISMGHINHTRGEEFAQKAIIDAGKQGNLNKWIWLVDNLKAFDPTRSYHMWHYRPHSALCCPFDKSQAVYITNPIDTGQVINTVRVHADTDFFGHIAFEVDEDLSDDWWENKTYWQVKDGGPSIEQPQDGGAHPNDFLYYNTLLTWPTYNKIRFGFTNPLAPNGGFSFPYLYSYVDVNNWNDIVMTNGATYMNFVWRKKVGGGFTTLANYNAQKDIDYWLEVQSQPPPAQSYVKIYRASDDFLVTTLTDSTVPSPGGLGLKCGPDDWYGSVSYPQICELDWHEIDFYTLGNYSYIAIAISRDNGTTWTSAAIAPGENHVDVNISGQPAGTTLLMRIIIKHPCRLYGLGMSWSNP